MYLKKSTKASTGRTQLSIVEGYRDENKIVRTKTIKFLGYLDELQKKYDDPIAHFKEVAKQMNLEKKETEKPITLEIDRTKKLPVGADNLRNLGYLAASKIYHELEIDQFFANRQRQTRAERTKD